MPGSSDSTPITAAERPSAFGLAANWRFSALSAAPWTPAFETRRPAAVETTSAGICVTSPSPAVRSV